MNKRNIIALIFAIFSVIASEVLLFAQGSDFLFFYYDNSLLTLIALLSPIVFLIMYVLAFIKKDKYFPMEKLNKCIIIFGASILLISLIDLFYNIGVIRKILLFKKQYMPIFINKYYLYENIIYLIFIIWIKLLKRTKIKRKIFDYIKIINCIIVILPLSYGFVTNGEFLLSIIPIIISLIFLVQLFISNKAIMLSKKVNWIMFITNAIWIIILLIDKDVISYLSFVIISVLYIIVIFKYINQLKKEKLIKIFKILTVVIYVLSIVLCIYLYCKPELDKTKDFKNNIVKGNAYSKKIDYDYVQISKDYKLKNKQDIKNAIYSLLDSGSSNATFVCSSKYKYCINDVKNIVESSDELTLISGFVHPNNHFKNINTEIYGSITKEIYFNVEKAYSKKKQEVINKKIDKIYIDNYDSNKSTSENIKVFHDYIINNCKYNKEDKYNNVYNLLVDGKSAGSGYSAVMKLFLDKMNIPNILIYSNNHVWNLVKVNNKWLHLDVSFDDPIVENDPDRNVLLDTYFLIDDEKLKSYNTNNHNYDKNIYKEFFE